MKLQTKLVLFNALSKILIAAAFILIVPFIIDKVALSYTDTKLISMRENVMHTIDKLGLKEFINEEQDSAFASYNIFKEEYISIEPLLPTSPHDEKIENAVRNIEGENVNFRVLDHIFIHKNEKYLLEAGRSLATIQKLTSLLKQLAFVVMIIILIISILFEMGFTGYLLKPFKFIIEKKVRATHHPDIFDFSTIPTNTDDFAYLDQSINEMMKKINDAFDREKEFIGNVSHELLTPISILQNRFENIISDSNTPKEVALKLVESQNTLNRLNKIIKTLLLISRIENEQYLKEDTVDVKLLLTEVNEEIEERLTEKNISLQINCDESFQINNCNKSLLFTMFFNLINNAVKYNLENGKILVKIYKNIVEITDTGIGISSDNLAHIFERFKKIKTIDNDSYGLGLPIVKTIALFHNVNIDFSSEFGKGTSVKLTFS